jgi:arylsulfatase A-like enzyme
MFIPYLTESFHREINFGPIANVPDWKPDPAGKYPGYKGWYSFGKPWRYVSDLDRDQMPDEISADFAMDVLNQKHDQPFFLAVGFMRPHVPLYVPTKYFDMYPPGKLKLPPRLTNDLDDCAVIQRERWKLGFQKWDALMGAGGEPLWRKWVQAYLASMTFADEQVGRVLTTLDKSPYRDNTIVILIGDNGYHLGEKSTVQKWYLWEESTQVPLLMRAPGAARGKVCKQPTSLIDLYPTLIDLCSLPKNPNAHKSEAPLGGHSLRQLLKNPTQGKWDGPDAALSVVSHEPDGPAGTGPHYSIRTVRWRYSLFSNGEEEMYDHDADPHEWTNLASHADFTAQKNLLRDNLTRRVKETTGPVKSSPKAPAKTAAK